MKDFFDKNTILGIFLIILLISGYTYYSKVKYEKAAEQAAIEKKFERNTSKNEVISPDKPISIDSVKSLTLSDTNIKGEILSIENDLIQCQISTKGAQIIGAKLKKHLSYTNSAVQILNANKTNTSINFASNSSSNILFFVKEQSAERLVLESSNGIQVQISLSPNSYRVSQVWYGDILKNQNIRYSIEAEMARAENNLQRERMYSTAYFLPRGEGDAIVMDKAKNESKEESRPIRWVSLTQQFFNYSIIPESDFKNGKIKTEYKEEDTAYVKKYTFLADVTASDSLKINYFIGPSDYKILKTLGNDLDQIVPLSQDFILFKWMKIFNIYLIIPIFDFLSKFISNYGIIILLLTLVIKLITAPFQYKQYKSGVAMRILKPELEKLKAKYGDDQQKYATEQMKIFNEVGVNPLGGCLPMIMQMPILFAMFAFFPAAIELRHQEFLWASDLSTYDSVLTLPFKILGYGSHVSLFALLSALTQIATTVYAQRLQPSSPQADQMKMMTYIMPVVFLFMFNTFPAALTYYYLLQNVLGVIQQWVFTTFIIKEDKVRAEMELAKKTPKKQGAFQQKMQDLMAQAEEQKKLQQKNNRK